MMWSADRRPSSKQIYTDRHATFAAFTAGNNYPRQPRSFLEYFCSFYTFWPPPNLPRSGWRMNLCHRRVDVKLHLAAALQELCNGFWESFYSPSQRPLSPWLFHRSEGQGARGDHRTGACLVHIENFSITRISETNLAKTLIIIIKIILGPVCPNTWGF